MGYLGTISRQGLLASVRHGDILWFDPQELITDEIRQLARTHKDELTAEIKGLCEKSDDSMPELFPSYRFLWVATSLESFEEYDPRYGYEIGRDPVYRMLDAPYYAWLRHRMDNVSKAHKAGRISTDEFLVLRDRFNAIHAWAVTRIGEDVLRRTLRTTNIKAYIPPCEETIAAYHRSWNEARRANAARQQRNTRSVSTNHEAARLSHLISTRGYAVVRSSLVDNPMVYRRDETVEIPDRYAKYVKFTVDELKTMVGASHETLRRIYEIKEIFGGRVMPPTDRETQRNVPHESRAFGPQPQLTLVSA